MPKVSHLKSCQSTPQQQTTSEDAVTNVIFAPCLARARIPPTIPARIGIRRSRINTFDQNGLRFKT